MHVTFEWHSSHSFHLINDIHDQAYRSINEHGNKQYIKNEFKFIIYSLIGFPLPHSSIPPKHFVNFVNIHKLNNVYYQCKIFHKWSPILFMSHVDNWYRTQTIFNFIFFEHGSKVSPLYNEIHQNQDGNNVPLEQPLFL